jgi:serine/threonine protein kinase
VQPNILINNETPPRACIADFGLCSIVPSRSFGPSRTIPGGTFGYMAPELFKKDARASKEADMYAFGMLVYEVITGARPFEHHRALALPTLTLQGSRPPRPEDPVAVGFGQGTWDFVERCWSENPVLRPSAREALDHFRRAARTSTDVSPGPTVPIHEQAHPKPESSSINLCECDSLAVFPF